jgi:hypothetical protein
VNLPLIKYVTEKLAALPTAANAQQRVAFAQELAAEASRRADEIEANSEKTIAQLRAENAELKRELTLRIPLEFVEHRGVLWKRLSAGVFAEDPYCPEHRAVMCRVERHVVCPVYRCGRAAPFEPYQQQAARESIPSDA